MNKLYTYSIISIFLFVQCKYEKVEAIEKITFSNYYNDNGLGSASGVLELPDGNFILTGWGDSQLMKIDKKGDQISRFSSTYSGFWIDDIILNQSKEIVVTGFVQEPNQGTSTRGMITVFTQELEIKNQFLSEVGFDLWFRQILENTSSEYSLLGLNGGELIIANSVLDIDTFQIKYQFPEYRNPTLSFIELQEGSLAFIAQKKLEPNKGTKYFLKTRKDGIDNFSWQISLDYSPSRIIKTASNRFLIVGGENGYPKISVLNSSGTVIIEKAIGSDQGNFKDVIELEDGFVFFGVQLLGANGGQDFLLLKMNKEFNNIIWKRNYGDVYDEFGEKLIRTNDDGLLMVGQRTNPEDRGPYVVKTDLEGNF